MDIENIYEFIFLFLADRLNNDKKNKGTKGRKALIKDNKIVNIFKKGGQWKNIKSIASYTVFYKKFKKQNQNNLFKEVYFILILYLTQHRYIKTKNINNTYIDSTMIINKQGSEYIGTNY